MANRIQKIISVDKNKFTIEVYPDLRHSRDENCPFWEIFPHDYHAALFAFSNKKKLNELIEKKFITKMLSV